MAGALGLLDSAEDVDTDIDRLMCFNLIGRGTWIVRFRRELRYRHRLTFSIRLAEAISLGVVMFATIHFCKKPFCGNLFLNVDYCNRCKGGLIAKFASQAIR